ncbi:MAG: hypothetical protein ACRDQA_16890 [Nocardioidaceae bacterium]
MNNPQNKEITPLPSLGTDGTPLVDDPIEEASRASRLADELAAMCEQLLGLLAWQDAALGMVRPASENAHHRLGQARQAGEQAATELTMIRDRLGEQHVTCDELAEQLRQVLSPARGWAA